MAAKEIKAGKTGIRRLFLDRIQREGRHQQYLNLCREMSDENPDLSMLKIQWEVMRKMGYAGPKEERRRAEEWRIGVEAKAARAEIQRDIIQEEIREEQKIATFEGAIRSLPEKGGSEAEELQWIRSHPAMARKSRKKDNTEPVLLTADDILHPPHGPAKCQAWVYSLQHWCNHPIEFYKQYMGEQKKKADDSNPEKIYEQDMDLPTVERLLKEMTTGYDSEKQTEAA